MPTVIAPSGGTTPWYVIWTASVSGLKEGQRQFHVVQTAKPPAFGSNYDNADVVEVQGPYTSKSAAENAVGSSTGTTGVGPGIANPNNQANQPPATPSNPLDFLEPIGNFFNDLGQEATWIRVAKILVGATIIIIGIVVMVKDTSTVKAIGKVASAVPGSAPVAGAAIRSVKAAKSVAGKAGVKAAQ